MNVWNLIRFLDAWSFQTVGTVTVCVGISGRWGRNKPLVDFILQIPVVGWKDLERILVLVGHTRVQIGLEVWKHREPDLDTLVVGLEENSVVGERMVIQKHAWWNVESDKHVDRVVLVSAQNKKQAEHVAHPYKRVHKSHWAWSRRIFTILFKTLVELDF